MPARNVVIGQHMDARKAQLANELRCRMTDEERVLWQALRTNQLGAHFRRQQVIDGFIVDFYCHAAGLVVEVDGPVHDERAEYDAERDQALSRRGVCVLRVTNEEVSGDLAAVLERIIEAVR